MESPEHVSATAFGKRKRTKRLPREEYSSTSSAVSTTTDEDEEEYTARCLILLARGGRGHGRDDRDGSIHKSKATAPYQCKTCEKCFPSFQALGGHRASHKKPRLAAPPPEAGCPPVTIRVGRVHECSICGSEFASGQALGGHMRRHRPVGPPVGPAPESPRNVLSLDLNLPAPSEESAFAFADRRTAALVDCRY